jgi:Fe-S oxidoreductase
MTIVFSPSDPKFWSAEDLSDDYRRQLETCHTCRICFNLCPAFPDFFSRIDKVDGDMDRISKEDLDSFTDLCYQCKLCFLRCPYVPPHEFAIDIPRLVLRARAVRAKERGVKMGDKILGDTDRLGEMGARTAKLANWGNRNPFTRLLIEKLVGVDRRRLTPEFHSPTFKKWFQKHPPPFPDSPVAKVALFYTCLVNYNDPSVGRALMAILAHNSVEVALPDQKCCGMPALDGGDMGAALSKAEFNVHHLSAYVDRGYDVIIPSPTCGYVVKKEYPHLLGTEEAEKVARHSYDVSELLFRLKKEGHLNLAFRTSPGEVAYHVPCHYKAQMIGNKYVELIRAAGGKVKVIDKGCSGIDGTWGMKEGNFEMSNHVAENMLSEFKNSPGYQACTDCLLAGLQITQGTRMAVKHPLHILAESYGLLY